MLHHNNNNNNYELLTPRDFIALRVKDKLEKCKANLKSLNYNNIDSKLPLVLDTLKYLKYALPNDLDASYEFGRIGGHQILLKMLTTFDDNEELCNSLGKVIDACTRFCSQFPMTKCTSSGIDLVMAVRCRCKNC